MIYNIAKKGFEQLIKGSVAKGLGVTYAEVTAALQQKIENHKKQQAFDVKNGEKRPTLFNSETDEEKALRIANDFAKLPQDLQQNLIPGLVDRANTPNVVIEVSEQKHKEFAQKVLAETNQQKINGTRR